MWVNFLGYQTQGVLQQESEQICAADHANLEMKERMTEFEAVLVDTLLFLSPM